MTTSRLLAGASGYSFKEWKGTFYPEKIKPEEMLPYYAERLPTVEINNTFYRMPKSEVLENWAATTPAHFRFAIKASKRITHISRIKAESAAEPLGYLYRNLAVLGAKRELRFCQRPRVTDLFERSAQFALHDRQLDHLGDENGPGHQRGEGKSDHHGLDQDVGRHEHRPRRQFVQPGRFQRLGIRAKRSVHIGCRRHLRGRSGYSRGLHSRRGGRWNGCGLRQHRSRLSHGGRGRLLRG